MVLDKKKIWYKDHLIFVLSISGVILGSAAVDPRQYIYIMNSSGTISIFILVVVPSVYLY